MLLFQHYCPTRSPRSPQNYDEYGRLIAKYPKDHLINSNTPGYTGTAHFPANIVAIGDGNGNRQGKLVKYATSEFRTSHLLDQVCDYADTFVPRYEGGWAPNATKAQRFEDVVRGKAKQDGVKVFG